MNALTTMFSVQVHNIIKHNSLNKLGVSMAPWALVAAARDDLDRPANLISVNQTVALSFLGFVGACHSLTLKPVSFKFVQLVPSLWLMGLCVFQLNRIHETLVSTGERVLSPGMKKLVLWDHPAGIKTIHFWSPLAKWGLVIAGFSDMMRPAEKLSKNQTISLFATGTIWSRYSMVIIPKNYALFTVNAFVGLVGLIQLTRIYMYEQELEKKKQAEAAAAKTA